MLSLRLVRSFIAVYEEGSVTRAAERESATQSGISQHILQIEKRHGVTLFERGARGVRPTLAADRLYRHCVAIRRTLDDAVRELEQDHASLSGALTVGLMPSLTRCALAPVLDRFTGAYPNVDVKVVEAYSGQLTELVRLGEVDFSIVPGFAGAIGLRTRLVARDREMLVTAANGSRTHLEAVRLRDLGPLKILVPGPDNTRRHTLDVYCETNGVEIERRLELDAMIGTLEFIAQSDWVAILPSVMLANDLPGARYNLHPLADPPCHLDLVLIEPERSPPTPQARAFAMLLEEAIGDIDKRWQSVLGVPEARRPAPRRKTRD